jgi:DNA-binding CsgD family transcriptional regulator
VSVDALIDHLVDIADALNAPDRSRDWTDDELRQLREGCAAMMTDIEIAIMLGRSEMAVHIKRERLRIPVVRRTPGWLSANQVRMRLGLNDQRPIIGWIQKGLVLGRLLPQGSTCWMVHEVSMRRFVTRPENWPYFNTEKVRDPHLKRLIALSKERWGDEWMTASQVSSLFGLNQSDINRFVRMGRIDAVRVHNKDGRLNVHEEPRWSYFYMRRSDVLNTKWDYQPGEACQKITERGLDWISRALAMGWTASAIARSMKLSGATVKNWIRKRSLGSLRKGRRRHSSTAVDLKDKR